jgi:hypothetical protein
MKVRTMLWLVFSTAALWALTANAHDINRYMRIRRM